MIKTHQHNTRVPRNPSRSVRCSFKKRVGIALATVFAVGVLPGCDQGGSGSRIPDPPELSGAGLAEGRSTWMQTCRNCHLTGVAGAPAIGNDQAWAERLPKGRTKLHASALNGIEGPSGWTMPPRGGNPRLSETQVKQAVDYMITVVVSRQPGTTIPE